MTDPFASPFDDEPTTATPFAEQTVIKAGDPLPGENTNEKETTLTNSDVDKITVTLKGGSGFDAPWIVLHSSSTSEANILLTEVQKNLTSRVAEVAKEFAGQVGPTAKGRTAQAAAPAAPAAQPVKDWPASPPATGGAKTCQHGERVRRTGTNARGTWVAHFCPTPKGTPDQCSPVWGD